MKNFYDILKNVCRLAHEDLPASFLDENSPYPELKQYIKDTAEEVCSRFPWTFREKKYTFTTVAGQREYEFPEEILPANIVKDGVRVENVSLPLYFMVHNRLDMLAEQAGIPCRYSVYSSKLILDPAPNNVLNIQVKYLTVNYAVDSETGLEKPNLETEHDLLIMPERYLKIIEWGAYALYRQNYKPDGKFEYARSRYLEYLLDMQKQDSYGGDSSPVIVIGSANSGNYLNQNRFNNEL